MTDTNDLVEQQIAKHEVQLKRIDALFNKADEVGREAEDPLMTALKSERDQLEKLLGQMRGEASENWQEASDRYFGPLAIWEALARVLEQAIESHERGQKS